MNDQYTYTGNEILKILKEAKEVKVIFRVTVDDESVITVTKKAVRDLIKGYEDYTNEDFEAIYIKGVLTLGF